MRDIWYLNHGPDRSHDALETIRCYRLKDARGEQGKLGAGRYWRIVKIAGGPKWSEHAITDVDTGGPDINRQRMNDRMRDQYARA